MGKCKRLIFNDGQKASKKQGAMSPQVCKSATAKCMVKLAPN